MFEQFTEYAVKKNRQMLNPELVGKNVALKSLRAGQLIQTKLFTVSALSEKTGFYLLKEVGTGKRTVGKHYNIAYIFKENDSITFESLLIKNEQYQQKYNELLKLKNEFWQSFEQ